MSSTTRQQPHHGHGHHSRTQQDDSDQFFNPEKKNTPISRTLDLARASLATNQRASLKNISKPETPANSSRQLFYREDYPSRPLT